MILKQAKHVLKRNICEAAEIKIIRNDIYVFWRKKLKSNIM